MKQQIKIISLTLGVLILGMFVSSGAYAGPVSTEHMVQQVQTSMSRQDILTAFDRKDVQSVLVAKGVDVASVKARVQAMTDQEIASLHADIDSLPAGAGAGGALLTVQ
jgi:hypothetical protein